MTCSTSDVAVCCSNASVRSVLSKVGGALAQFVEQPRVLDGDDGLGGEVLDQLDLLIGKGANFLVEDCDGADQFVVLEHRGRDEASCPAKVNEPDEISVALLIRCILKAVRNVQQLFCGDHASKHPTGADRRFASPEFDKGWRRIMTCGDVECGIFIP